MRLRRLFRLLNLTKTAAVTGSLALAACGAASMTALELSQWQDDWAKRGAVALEADDFIAIDYDRARLGQDLFFDRILSGNRNISCSTCHHHSLGTTDQLPLGVGEGGRGLGLARKTGSGPGLIHERVPRNSPALFNVGAKEIAFVFHDGRLSIDESQPSGFKSPAKENMPLGLTSIVAAQAMFPPTSATEMAGQVGENPVADASKDGMHLTWPLLADRVRSVPRYVEAFSKVYDDVDGADDISMVHIANALGDYIAGEWRSFNTPYDRFLRGDQYALSQKAQDGMELFFGKARCSTCHNGPLLTDHDFHAIAVPQFGGGKMPAGHESAADRGRQGITNNPADAFAFRTPALRNVALTAPYMHDGAFATLEAAVRHHLDPISSLREFDAGDVRLPDQPELAARDFKFLTESKVIDEMIAANDLEPVALTFDEMTALVTFLRDGLTEKGASNGRLGPIKRVPSGLAVD